uniref:V2 n=1 Tax=Bindweed mottle virus TaxID=3076663 RepID=A0AA96C7R2_9GEMI|nr:V2 [Bindweed mottle virus]
MAARLYTVDELPDTYGKLQALCTTQWLQDQREKAKAEHLYGQGRLYSALLIQFKRAQRRKDPWPVKVAQFNEDLRAAINTAQLRKSDCMKEAQFYLAQNAQKNFHTELGTEEEEDQPTVWNRSSRTRAPKPLSGAYKVRTPSDPGSDSLTF